MWGGQKLKGKGGGGGVESETMHSFISLRSIGNSWDVEIGY